MEDKQFEEHKNNQQTLNKKTLEHYQNNVEGITSFVKAWNDAWDHWWTVYNQLAEDMNASFRKMYYKD